jgi:recombination protein RecA
MKKAHKKPSEPTKGPKLDTDVSSVLDELRAQLGEEGAQILGSDEKALKIRGVISTGIPSFDRATGRGGIPIGRLTILHGGEGGSKTTVALKAVANAQKMGGFASYFDEEYKLDPDWAVKHGVNPKRLIISQPGNLERVLEGMGATISAMDKIQRKPGIIVVDSINACTPQAVLDGDTTDHHMAPWARLWSKHLPKLVKEASKRDIAIVLISQVRSKMNIQFGDADEIAGGKAPRFYASLIAKITRVNSISVAKEGGGKDKVANEIEVLMKKNQISAPFKTGRFILNFEHGVEFSRNLLEECLECGLVQLDGNKIMWDGNVIAKNMNRAISFLDDDKDVRNELNRAWRSKMGWEVAT